MNVGNKDEILGQNGETMSSFFMSPDISMEINKIVGNLTMNRPMVSPRTNVYRKQNESALDHYNRMYKNKFLRFEEIMFNCGRTKLEQIKSNLLFFVLCSDQTVTCLVCNTHAIYDVHTWYEHVSCKQHIMLYMELQESSEKLRLINELMSVRSTYVKCYSCNVKLTNNTHIINKHINHKEHKTKRTELLNQVKSYYNNLSKEVGSHLWYSIQYFACVPCKKRFKMKIEFIEHLDTKHMTVMTTSGDSTEFDFCIKCATLWYTDENCGMIYRNHCQKLMHQYLAKNDEFAVRPLPLEVQQLMEHIEETTANLIKLSEDILLDPKSDQLINSLKHTLKSYHSSAVEVHMFGSRYTGLALSNSDLDIYLDFGNECTEAKLIKSRSEQIQDCLHSDGETWEVEQILDRTRTPIIKLRHELTGLQCDISFTNSLSLENSKFIKSFNMAYSPCRKLILFLRKWMSLWNYVGSDGITNYALTWLVIFYLQVKQKIPSVATLIESHNKSKIVSGWLTGVNDTIAINVPEVPIRTLLLGFFDYYGEFDYMHSVVCPLLGYTCNKESFTEILTLPEAMALYVAQLRGVKPEYFRVDSSICVQDPFDLSHNLTKAVQTLTLKRFKQYCNESASILRQNNAVAMIQ